MENRRKKFKMERGELRKENGKNWIKPTYYLFKIRGIIYNNNNKIFNS